MARNLRQYLKAQYSIMLLDFPTRDFSPGDLVKAHRFWRPGDFGYEVELQDKRGSVFDLLNIAPLVLAPRQPTLVAVNDVVDSFQLDANVGLPQFGLTASLSIQSGVTITWNITSVETVTIDKSGITKFQELLQRMPTVAKEAKNSWVKECHVLRQVFYTNGLSGTVHTKGTLNGKETFQHAGILAPAGLNLTWDNDDTFRVVGPNDVPFGAWAQAAA